MLAARHDDDDDVILAELINVAVAYIISFHGGACGVMVIVVGNGHGDTS